MQFDIQEMIQLAATQTPRLDMYVAIHKAIRALMCDTLLAVGRADPQDDTELAPALDKVDELLTFCEHHVFHENTFVHPAIEARAPGMSDAVTAEHDAHLAHINTLRLATLAVRRAPAAQRDAMTLALYRQLALFVADNFQHMHVEETAHNHALWQHYSDAELHATHQALVASIPPEEMMFTLRWMVPHMNAGERTMMMTDMQANAPAPAFAAAIDVVRPHLNASEWAKLARPLGLAPVPGLVR
jgi:hypothetical protein